MFGYLLILSCWCYHFFLLPKWLGAACLPNTLGDSVIMWISFTFLTHLFHHFLNLSHIPLQLSSLQSSSLGLSSHGSNAVLFISCSVKRSAAPLYSPSDTGSKTALITYNTGAHLCFCSGKITSLVWGPSWSSCKFYKLFWLPRHTDLVLQSIDRSFSEQGGFCTVRTQK